MLPVTLRKSMHNRQRSLISATHTLLKKVHPPIVIGTFFIIFPLIGSLLIPVRLHVGLLSPLKLFHLNNLP